MTDERRRIPGTDVEIVRVRPPGAAFDVFNWRRQFWGNDSGQRIANDALGHALWDSLDPDRIAAREREIEARVHRETNEHWLAAIDGNHSERMTPEQFQMILDRDARIREEARRELAQEIIDRAWTSSSATDVLLRDLVGLSEQGEEEHRGHEDANGTRRNVIDLDSSSPTGSPAYRAAITHLRKRRRERAHRSLAAASDGEDFTTYAPGEDDGGGQTSEDTASGAAAVTASGEMPTPATGSSPYPLPWRKTRDPHSVPGARGCYVLAANGKHVADDLWEDQADRIVEVSQMAERAEHWQEEARRYAMNADYWQGRFQQNADTLVAHAGEIVALRGKLDEVTLRREETVAWATYLQAKLDAVEAALAGSESFPGRILKAQRILDADPQPEDDEQPAQCCGTCGWNDGHMSDGAICTAPLPDCVTATNSTMDLTEGTDCPCYKPKEESDAT